MRRLGDLLVLAAELHSPAAEARRRAARAETQAFLAAYPDSEYRRMVQGVTGIHPRPGRPVE
jgi:hypothetical protein